MNELTRIKFNGNELAVIERDGTQYVAMKPIVETLGLDWEKQRQLIRRDEVLNSTASVMEVVAEDGKMRDMVCLPLNKLNGWLFKIPASRYTGKRHDAIIKYQEECYDVLFDYFHKGAAVNPGITEEQLTRLMQEWSLERKTLFSTIRELTSECQYQREALTKAAQVSAPNCNYGDISPRNGLPRVRLRRSSFVADPRCSEADPNAIQLLLTLNITGGGIEVISQQISQGGNNHVQK